MSAGGYSSDEVYLMNESYAFYTYTNTYRNPIFGSSQEEEEDFQYCHTDEVGASSAKRSQECANDSKKTSAAKTGADPGGTTKTGAPASSLFHQSTSKLPLIEETRQRWAEIRDNLAFSARDKLFVMELNFKRRLRSLRTFISRKLPPWFATRTTAPSGKTASGIAASPTTKRQKSLPRRRAAATTRRPVFVGANLGDLLREERAQQQQARDGIAAKQHGAESGAARRQQQQQQPPPPQHQQQQQRRRLFNLSEPISAEALSAQQERILNRLERIKRDNQKLSSASQLLARQQQFGWRPTSNSNLELSSVGAANGGGGQSETAPAQVGPTAPARLPKSASSPGGQVAAPFWLVRSNSKDEADADAGAPANSCSTTAAHDATDTAPAAATTSSLTASLTPPSRPSASNLAETVKAAATTATKTASSRVTGPFSKCARATSGFISSVQGQTRRKSRSGGGAANAADEPAEQKKTCIVCYERAPNIVTLPCEHSDVCSDCFVEIIYIAVKNSQYPLRCVLCRTKVERIRCSRRLMLSVNRSRGGSKFGLLSI